MRHLIFIVFMVLGNLIFSQSVTQIKIVVNDDLYILSDVTATPDSIPHGRHLIIYKNRTLVRGSVKDGLMDGIWTTFHPNGQQKMKGRYVKGLPHGEWFFWGISGDIQAKYQYNHGTPVGHWQGYYFNHSKAIDLIFNGTGKPEQCIHYYQDEIISLNHVFTYKAHDVLEDRSYYYKNYNIFYYEQLENNQRHGMVRRYHKNALLWESYIFNHGKLSTVNKGYSNGGVPKKNETFRDGKGIVKRYYSNGNLFSETNYSNGYKNDSVVIYDLSTKQSGIGHFTNGRPTGKWDIYSKYHKLVEEYSIALDSNYCDAIQHPTPAPKEIVTGHYKDGFMHGLWKSYNNFGELIWESNYYLGFKNGKTKRYQSNKLMEEFNYSFDNKSGDFNYYSTFGELNSTEKYESESTLDTNWFKAPEEGWIAVYNPKSETHQKRIAFYPYLPGMEIVTSGHGPIQKNEGMFEVQRAIPYNYWPELISAKFQNGAYEEKEYIRKHLTTNKPNLKHHVSGKVLIRYKVNQIGLISDIVVLKTLGFGLDEVAVNMVKAFPPLSPATLNGIPIDSYIVREFDFSY